MSLDRHAAARRVIELLEEPLARDGFELLDVRVHRGGGRQTVRIYLDRDDGMTLDACVGASRTAGMLLEEADPFPEAYVVEVSSPGVRRPLRTDAHFEAAAGRDVSLKLVGGGRGLKGKLMSYADGVLTVQPRGDDEEPREIAVGDVLEANLESDFDPQALIRNDRRRRKEKKRRERRERRDPRDGK